LFVKKVIRRKKGNITTAAVREKKKVGPKGTGNDGETQKFKEYKNPDLAQKKQDMHTCSGN